MKKANNFQIAKVQPRVLPSFYLTFCQFPPGVAYKSVAHKKACVFAKRSILDILQSSKFASVKVLVLLFFTLNSYLTGRKFFCNFSENVLLNLLN